MWFWWFWGISTSACFIMIVAAVIEAANKLVREGYKRRRTNHSNVLTVADIIRLLIIVTFPFINIVIGLWCLFDDKTLYEVVGRGYEKIEE